MDKIRELLESKEFKIQMRGMNKLDFSDKDKEEAQAANKTIQKLTEEKEQLIVQLENEKDNMRIIRNDKEGL